jgi:DNA polymerase III subunit beta
LNKKTINKNMDSPLRFSIHCEKHILIDAVKFANGFISARPSHPILGGILLTARDEFLEIQATNLDQGCKLKIPCTTEIKGGVVLPGKQFNALLNNLVGDTISIYLTEADSKKDIVSNTDYIAVIRSGQQEAALVTNSPNEYPDIEYSSESNLEVDAELFSTAIQKTVHCTSSDLSKIVLCGINISSSLRGLTFSATNGHYLATATIPGNYQQEIDLTVPGAFLSKVQKLLKNAETLTLGMKDSRLTAELTTNLSKGNIVDIALYSRLLDGSFPACEKLIPATFEREVLFSREQLTQSLNLISSCDSESGSNEYTCSFEIQDTQTKITKSGSSVLNVCQLTNSTLVTGDGLTIGFNYLYFKNHLSALSSDEIVLKMNGERSPVIMHGQDEALETTLLIMPVQLK